MLKDNIINNNGNMKIIDITNLHEILHLKDNVSNIKLYIDIDKTCMTTERIIARVFNNNYILRNRIMFNTKKTSFNYTDNLIPTRYDLGKFINLCKNKFKYIAYVTKRSHHDLNKIKKELALHNIPIDIDIINHNDIKNIYDNTFYYIDSDINNTFVNKDSILFHFSIF